ncbi:hypothetical protein H4R35_005089 [Dimargaris xerosporica]|nr:hypothetical protein H4R35_005089 [Dimargaris xerosporica]
MGSTPPNNQPQSAHPWAYGTAPTAEQSQAAASWSAAYWNAHSAAAYGQAPTAYPPTTGAGGHGAYHHQYYGYYPYYYYPPAPGTHPPAQPTTAAIPASQPPSSTTAQSTTSSAAAQPQSSFSYLNTAPYSQVSPTTAATNPPQRNDLVNAKPLYSAVKVKKSKKKKSTPTPSTPAVKPEPTAPVSVPAPPQGAAFDASKQSAVAKNWPPDLKEYVTRAFKQCPAMLKDEVEKELKAIILQKHRDEALLLTNWDQEPLPKQCISTHSKPTKPSRAPSPLLPSNVQAPHAKRRKGSAIPDSDPERGLNAQEIALRKKRQSRFANGGGEGALDAVARGKPASPPPMTFEPEQADAVIDWDKHTIVGTCTKLEKQYLRLTSAPNPATVRPLHVLKQTLELLKQKWRAEANYPYIRDQFKSMRQDLTVQRIKNDFTVRVYEVNARIALETSDMGEYNLCQAQLGELYKYKLPGHQNEFLAYKILYFIYIEKSSDINAVLATITATDKTSPPVAHALQVRQAIANFNYHQLFRLYLDAPNLNSLVMDQFIERERVKAMAAISKSYRPTVSVAFITQELGFKTTSKTLEFLHKYSSQLDQASDGSWRLQCIKSQQPFVDGLRKPTKSDITGQI